ncbi:Adenylate kinase family protein [Histomonas meleagridis]|uniref:Adenylate kinase family protein n=1 Tax=Histomonas meleagridis TaxID=135588 RepID=UPI0035595DAC|nr:Adenylate kinase family protein [Histomonas meleagridis]KAH0802531.1 Adenylate kinase family protein [Histomonas meleagridis]
MTSLKHKVVVCLLGGPGSGKGTISELIKKSYDVGYMSAGELLRNAAKADTPEGRSLAEQLKRGEIVPQEITIGLLRAEIEKQEKSLYLIDGFPRQVDQAQTFEETVVSPKAVLFLDAPDDVLVGRLMNRGLTSGRSDDNEESIKLRIKVYHEKCIPVNGYFGERLHVINANRPPDVTFQDVKKVLDKILEETSKDN